MNLFFSKLFGKLHSTEKMEAYIAQMEADIAHYRQVEQSAEFEEYKQLKQMVESTAFVEKKRQLTQKKKSKDSDIPDWQTTEEYQKERRFIELTSSPDIKFYLLQDVKKIEQMEHYTLTFADEFKWGKLTDSKWRAGFSYKNKNLKNQHSFTNEKQANNGGNNVEINDGVFTLLTKQEKVVASAWDTIKGFVNKEFEYTSDVVQTADNFRQEEGLFMIKLRSEGKIHHAAWLGADSKLPMLTLFHYNGKNIVVGNMANDGFSGEKVTGINPSMFYIYSLRWTKKELIWYVNNMEVYRTERNVPKEALYVALSSFISANQKATTGKLEVDWVRVYKY